MSDVVLKTVKGFSLNFALSDYSTSSPFQFRETTPLNQTFILLCNYPNFQESWIVEFRPCERTTAQFLLLKTDCGLLVCTHFFSILLFI
jgi:hypothetical protein